MWQLIWRQPNWHRGLADVHKDFMRARRAGPLYVHSGAALTSMRPGPKQCVGFGTVERSLGLCYVYVGAEGCVVGKLGKGI